ncbi:MAG: hypothetical protein J6D28_06275 [Bacilli bacterium]|nr:hypothetical protein [Bacilli bacterium]
MEEVIYLNNLYDYYKSLLTEKQKMYFEEYYQNNLTLSEIADNYGISRNAVHKQLKDTVNLLNEYESKLQIVEKNKKIINLVKKDKKILKEIERIIG